MVTKQRQARAFIATKWGDYDIAVTVGPSRLTPSGMISRYEVSKAGRLLIVGRVPAEYLATKDAVESSLCAAKIDARESLSGPFPAN